MQATLHRLNDLRWITDSGHRASSARSAQRGRRKAKPKSLQPKQSRRTESRVYRGLAQDLSPLLRVAELCSAESGTSSRPWPAWRILHDLRAYVSDTHICIDCGHVGLLSMLCKLPIDLCFTAFVMPELGLAMVTVESAELQGRFELQQRHSNSSFAATR